LTTKDYEMYSYLKTWAIFLTKFTSQQVSGFSTYVYPIMCLSTPTFLLVLYFWNKHC